MLELFPFSATLESMIRKQFKITQTDSKHIIYVEFEGEVTHEVWESAFEELHTNSSIDLCSARVLISIYDNATVPDMPTSDAIKYVRGYFMDFKNSNPKIEAVAYTPEAREYGIARGIQTCLSDIVPLKIIREQDELDSLIQELEQPN